MGGAEFLDNIFTIFIPSIIPFKKWLFRVLINGLSVPQIFKQLFFVLDYFPLTNQEVGIFSNWLKFLKMDLRILEGFWNMEPNFRVIILLGSFWGQIRSSWGQLFLSAGYYYRWLITRGVRSAQSHCTFIQEFTKLTALK